MDNSLQERSQAVSFTIGVWQNRAKLFVQIPKQDISWTTYLDVFNTSFWLTVLCLILSSSSVLYIMFR